MAIINDFNLIPQTMHDMYLHTLLDEVRAMRKEIRELLDKDKPKEEMKPEGKAELKPKPQPMRVREPRS